MYLVNDKNIEEIDFETLGSFFQLIDVYKDIDEINTGGEMDSQETKIKRQKEIRFHRSFWKLFSNDLNGKIKVGPVIEIFLQLYTSDLNHCIEVEQTMNSNLIQ